jgi:hypothetical protein
MENIENCREKYFLCVENFIKELLEKALGSQNRQNANFKFILSNIQNSLDLYIRSGNKEHLTQAYKTSFTQEQIL